MNGIMIQATSSDAGKSFIVTGLCRLFADMGIKICPFKSQNMSNNSYVTHDGREISTAQAVQARAARLEPETFMNPILLKPRHDRSSEIILNGKVHAPDTKNYRVFTQTTGIFAVREALSHIEKNFQAVIIEGAGSPAEINLNAFEIVNMRIAREADVPVILVADVDKGGSLASIAGTLELLGQDRARVKGIIFNKFRGDINLFADAVSWTENYTGVKVLGVVPFLSGAKISPEDSLNICEKEISLSPEKINIGIINFPGIANFGDFDALAAENDVEIFYIDGNISVKIFHELDAVILPGTKNTFLALEWLKNSGLFDAMKNFEGKIFGICGGLQILGREIFDEHHRENLSHSYAKGLGLLPIITSFNEDEKITRQVSGKFYDEKFSGEKISGYEIHFGRTKYFYDEKFAPLFLIENNPEGITDGKISGTYLHGIFNNENFRASWLGTIKNRGVHEKISSIRAADDYDVIAKTLAKNLDVKFIARLARIPI